MPCCSNMYAQVSGEAKEFVYNLLKFDPKKRMTCQEALNSRWLQANCHGKLAAESSPEKRGSIAAKTLDR